MKTHRIALYPGDGIGPDVVDAACAVLDAVERGLGGFHLEYRRFDWGMAHYDQHGQVAPDDFLTTLRGFDAIFLGAVGWPARLPDHVTLAPLIRMRQTFDLYACVRPARTFSGVPRPLRRDDEIDLVVVRENSEGEYVDNGGVVAAGTADEVAIQSAVHTRRGVERILRFSFDLARQRRRRLTMITKSNAQRYAYVLWDRVLAELAPQYADVATDKLHIDAATLELVRRPHTFDVIVGSNLFGDILSDLTRRRDGQPGIEPVGEPRPAAARAVAVRAGARLGPRHRGQGHRESRRRGAQRGDDARVARRDAGGRRDPGRGRERPRRWQPHAGSRRDADHHADDVEHRGARRRVIGDPGRDDKLA